MSALVSKTQAIKVVKRMISENPVLADSPSYKEKEQFFFNNQYKYFTNEYYYNYAVNECAYDNITIAEIKEISNGNIANLNEIGEFIGMRSILEILIETL